MSPRPKRPRPGSRLRSSTGPARSPLGPRRRPGPSPGFVAGSDPAPNLDPTPSSVAPPGMLVDIGGRRLHLLCIGRGDPTVLFEASGWGVSSLSAAMVRERVSSRARVCSYDRMGMGWSDPGPSVVTAGELARQLAVLQDRAGLNGPFILVGSSVGGLTIEMFGRRYPERTAGLVFLDAAIEVVECVERVVFQQHQALEPLKLVVDFLALRPQRLEVDGHFQPPGLAGQLLRRRLTPVHVLCQFAELYRRLRPPPAFDDQLVQLALQLFPPREERANLRRLVRRVPLPGARRQPRPARAGQHRSRVHARERAARVPADPGVKTRQTTQSVRFDSLGSYSHKHLLLLRGVGARPCRNPACRNLLTPYFVEWREGVVKTATVLARLTQREIMPVSKDFGR